MANKLYAMELLTEEVAKDSCQSAGMDAVPKHFIQTVQIHFSRTAFNLCTATGSNCRSIHGNLESEDVPLDKKGIQGDCLD